MRSVLVLLVPLAVSAQTVIPFSESVREGRGLCVERAAERVCLTAVGEAGDARIEARRRNGAVRWTGHAHPMSAQVDLRAFRVDLAPTGGGLVVAERVAVSNGMAVETWTLYVLPDDADAPTYQFEARDIGSRGAPFATWEGELVYWATEWQDAADPTGRRGPGYYLVGRPFQVAHDGLLPVTSLPIRSRRMLYDFRQERGGPVSWLSDRRAETRRHDPFWGGRPLGDRGEVVEVGEAEDYRYTLAVRVGERRRTFTVGALKWDEGAARLGDGATGRLFPEWYRPAGLVGRSVRVGRGPERARVLWLDERRPTQTASGES